MTTEQREQCMEVLAEADSMWTVEAVTMAMIVIMRHHPELTFADMDEMLRELHSETHLLAVPTSVGPPGYPARHPVTRELRDYALWVCFHGRSELERQRAVFTYNDKVK